MKRLKIEAEIPLPDDAFEAAEALGKMREPIKHLEEAVMAVRGKVTHSVVAERAPKKAKEERDINTRDETPVPLVPRHGRAAE